MLTINHVLTGGAVAVAVAHYTDNPFIIVLAAVASHFILDAIPHLDVPPSAPRDENGHIVMTPAIWLQVFVDGIISFIAVMSLWARFGFPDIAPFFLGSVSGVLPDLIDNVPFWNKKIHRWPGFKQFYRFHELTHEIWNDHFPMEQIKSAYFGAATEIIMAGLSLWYLLAH